MIDPVVEGHVFGSDNPGLDGREFRAAAKTRYECVSDRETFVRGAIAAARQAARRETRMELAAAGFRYELTPSGEQAVIPGCERDRDPSIIQMELF